MAYTVVGESQAHAEEREQMFLNDLVDPMASLTLLSELHELRLLRHRPRRARSPTSSSSRCRGSVGWCRTSGRTSAATRSRSRDLAGHRATLLQGPRFVGTGTEVADQMEEWFNADACDGFVIAATHTPGAYEDVVRLVVPELQRRGVFRDQYTGDDAARAPGDRPARAAAPRWLSTAGPLDGLRVVDAATLAAGPMVATVLGRVRRRGHQGRAARRGRPAAHLGRPQGRHRPGVEEREPQQALRDPRPAPARGTGAVPPAARRQRRAGRRQPAQRAGPVGSRLRVGARAPPAAS